MPIALHAFEVRKILKDHGTSETEPLRGQEPISINDFDTIKECVQNPDAIRLSQKMYMGNHVIEFVKTLKGRTTVVTYVESGKRDLRVQTMYKGIEKKSVAPLKDANASLNAPVTADTSETKRGTAPKNSIADETKKGKNKFSLSEEVDVEKHHGSP